jgi:protein SCO1/2
LPRKGDQPGNKNQRPVMSSRPIALAATAAVATLVVGSFVAVQIWQPANSFEACAQSQAAGAIGGPFTLIDTTGATVTDADVLTEPSLIYFGYTFCPDVCPIDNGRNAEAVVQLSEQGISATPVFITIDPERDTPEVLADYTANFGVGMVGLTGSDAQIAEVAREYKTFYQKEVDGDPDYYLMDHMAFTYIFIPGHGVVDFVRREATAEDIAARVACFVAAA